MSDAGAAANADPAESEIPEQGAPSTAGGRATSEAGADGCAPGAVDEPDDQGVDSNCDGADGIVGTDVYVDPMSGQDTNDGSPTAPVQSLAQAFSIAQPRQGHILMAGGQVGASSLPFREAWSLYGGYTPAFVGPPNRQNTVLVAPASGLLVDGSTTSGQLCHLTVQSQGSTDPTQPSVHGLRSRAAELAIDDVVIQAADALGGVSGTPGASGLTGSAQGCGAAYPAFALGQRYDTPAIDGTSPGTLSNGGTPAVPAGGGFAGSDGDDAPGGIQLLGDLVTGGAATAGSGNGDFGYGGAGGLLATGYLGTYQIWGGQGGNGGCPGGGGAPGSSGGSSAALIVLAGHVAVTRSALVAGYGGDGGDGGSGGPGGEGALGSLPELVAPAWPKTLTPTCAAPEDDAMGLNCAEYGGKGGPGGAGGRGGGGAGGWSVGILVASGATESIDTATTISVKSGGSGGVGNGGAQASAGEARAVCTLGP